MKKFLLIVAVSLVSLTPAFTLPLATVKGIFEVPAGDVTIQSSGMENPFKLTPENTTLKISAGMYNITVNNGKSNCKHESNFHLENGKVYTIIISADPKKCEISGIR